MANKTLFEGLKDVVDGLVKEYPVALAEVDSKRILYLKTDAKPRKSVVKVAKIPVPHPSVTPFKFCITVWSQVYDELDQARQVLHTLRELLRIRDFEEQKLDSYPLQDFPEIVEKYGATWEDDEQLPNPLDKTATAAEDEEEDVEEEATLGYPQSEV